MSELGIITAVFFLANMAVLGLNLKLYTEIMKEKSQRRHGSEKAE